MSLKRSLKRLFPFKKSLKRLSSEEIEIDVPIAIARNLCYTAMHLFISRRSTPAVIFWQWVNQSFNAIVNYTNRSGSSPIPTETLARSYVGATGGAVITALTLNRLAQRGPPLAGRLVPLAAVAAANCVNIPLMRVTELQNGIELQAEDGTKVGHSKRAAQQAIATVTLSRIFMASPSMSRFHYICFIN